MVWATVFVFRKTKKAKQIFDMIKYVKKYYSYFNNLYRVFSKNYRNDYVFAIALQQLNGFVNYDTFPFALSTLPPDCRIVNMSANGIAWQYNDRIDYIENQDVHILNKEITNV